MPARTATPSAEEAAKVLLYRRNPSGTSWVYYRFGAARICQAFS
jgi:hypothetical protein